MGHELVITHITVVEMPAVLLVETLVVQAVLLIEFQQVVVIVVAVEFLEEEEEIRAKQVNQVAVQAAREVVLQVQTVHTMVVQARQAQAAQQVHQDQLEMY